MSTVEEWTDEQLDLAIFDAYIPRIPGQVSLMREAFVALQVARSRIAELEAIVHSDTEAIRQLGHIEEHATARAEQAEAELAKMQE